MNRKKTITLVTALMVIFSTIIPFNSVMADPHEATLTTTNSGVSEYMLDPTHGEVIHLYAPDKAETEANKGTIVITLPDGTTLADITSVAWEVYSITGYPPHIDMKLDVDKDGEIDESLVFEYAYQPYVGEGYAYAGTPGEPYGHYDPALQEAFYNPIYETWVYTFQNSETETETDIITDSSVCWLASGLPGPYTGGYFGTLLDFKDGAVLEIDGTATAPVDSTTPVLEFRIEVDNWIGESEAFVRGIIVNSETLVGPYKPELSIVSPISQSYTQGGILLEVEAWDIFGVDSITYNLKDGADAWVYTDNKTYSSVTSLTGLSPETYTLYVLATNSLGLKTEKSLTFNIIPSSIEVSVSPDTLNLRSAGNWITVKILLPEGASSEDFDVSKIRLEINGEIFEPVWGVVEDGKAMVKFDRGDIAEILEEGECTVTIRGELPNGEHFEGKDNIWAINPGKGKQVANQNTNRNSSSLNNRNKAKNNNHNNGNKKDLN